MPEGIRCDKNIHIVLFKKNNFQTEHINLDVTIAYPKLDTNTRPVKLRMIDSIANPAPCGTLSWMAGAIL